MESQTEQLERFTALVEELSGKAGTPRLDQKKASKQVNLDEWTDFTDLAFKLSGLPSVFATREFRGYYCPRRNIHKTEADALLFYFYEKHQVTKKKDSGSGAGTPIQKNTQTMTGKHVSQFVLIDTGLHL